MPRIALLSTSYPAHPGDPCGHFVATEAALLARDADVVVIAGGPGVRVEGPREEGGAVRVWRVGGGGAFGWPGVAARVRSRPWRALGLVAWARQARALLRALGRFDRVVAHWAVPSGLLACGVLPGVPLELVSHGADVRLLAGLPRALRRRVVRRLLDHATAWRFVSSSLQHELAEVLDHPDLERLRLLARVEPAAIDLPDARIRSAELRARGPNAPLRVMVGRLVPSKRFDRALDALTSLAPGRVVVVGDGPERARLERHAQSLGLAAEFLGTTSRDEALAWIGAADLLLHASRAEGLSTVVREAEALGTPVLMVP